ncbi:sensor histidine kinase [Dactylosporangium sp. CA-092794]|uniref:sensor histidine kinase n=1 Tax=Dactylosporangium sp. CA-092794 TaxID=3239929 RepID=UPI003D8E0040
MRRLLATAGIVAVDSALLTYAHPGPPRPALLPVWALVVGSLIWLRYRNPAAAFVGALVPAAFAGGALAVLAWSGYQAGRSARGRAAIAGPAVAVGIALGVRIALRPEAAAPLVAAMVVFAVLPWLSGLYVAQQRRQALALAAQERLRIARDMHDALGHRLSLVSVQAAALEVAELPAEQRAAVRRLAEEARIAASDLHDVVGALRSVPPKETIRELVERVRAAGAGVEFVERGAARPVDAEVERAAYRVVQEGLTNGLRHAPGAPLTVRAEWEDDGLLVSVVNPAARGGAPGGGLTGLAERAALAGGLAGHGLYGGEFRLWAVFPVAAPTPRRPPAAGIALAGLLFGLLPLSMLVGLG